MRYLSDIDAIYMFCSTKGDIVSRHFRVAQSVSLAVTNRRRHGSVEPPPSFWDMSCVWVFLCVFVR